jgi:hypothetical protein
VAPPCIATASTCMHSQTTAVGGVGGMAMRELIVYRLSALQTTADSFRVLD